LAVALPARAEPVLMFLLGFARNLAESAHAARPRIEPAPVATTAYPGTTVEPAILKRLIDDSFLYLSSDQREEIFQTLHAELMKPGNFAVRGPMIEHFAHRALQVRAAQMRLARLSAAEKEVMAGEFAKEVKSLPAEEAGQIRQALEKNLLPVPADLNRLFLAAIVE
jgi:hypothetical protein